MKQTLGWIVENNVSGMAERLLLGRTCREHVHQAMIDSGAMVAEDERAFSGPFDVVLLAREDAPCLVPATLAALTKAVGEGTAATGVLMSHPQREAMAMAIPREKWFAAMKSYSLSTKEIAKMLLSARNEKPAPTQPTPGTPGAQTGPVPGPQLDTPEACIAVTDAVSYATAYRILRERIVQRHLESGVFLLDPERVVIEAEVRISPGAMIYSNNLLMGRTTIGAGCTLYPGNRLQNATVAEGVTIESSVLLDCSVGGQTTVGPFAYLRPDTNVGSHCRIGDFVEVKNSTIGDHTKVSHLTYVGDSDLGQNINLGCGVVFVNYDGKVKSRCTVEDNAFIGCNCNLVAPVTIGENAYLAAGSTVVEDVPADALYVARARGTVKEGWVDRRKAEGKL